MKLYSTLAGKHQARTENKVIQDIADDLGVKKAEYVKNLVVEELMNIKFGMKNEKRSDKKWLK